MADDLPTPGSVSIPDVKDAPAEFSVDELDPATKAMHADDFLNNVNDVAPPLHVSTTFRYPRDPNDFVPIRDLKVHTSADEPHCYSRHTSPSTSRLEAILTALLHAPALTYGSGCAAYHAALVLINPQRISIGKAYSGCLGLINMHNRLAGTCQKLPLDCPVEDLQSGDLIHLETPQNPTGEAHDIAYYAKKAHSRGAYLLVDSTFGPPGLQDPFELGADIVMHSGTKYIGGHSDMLCGVLATRDEKWHHDLLQQRLYLGSVMGNMEGWLGVRSIRTMNLRVQRESQNASSLVHFLYYQLKSPSPNSVNKVLHSVTHASLQSLTDPATKAWLTKQMPNGYGPVFSIYLKTKELAKWLPSKLNLFMHATSLGGVESLVEWRYMTDPECDPRLVRVSVGVEAWEDLRDDLIRGFEALGQEVEWLPVH